MSDCVFNLLDPRFQIRQLRVQQVAVLVLGQRMPQLAPFQHGEFALHLHEPTADALVLSRQDWAVGVGHIRRKAFGCRRISSASPAASLRPMSTSKLPDLLIDGPHMARTTIVLAHGAGAGMDTEFMNAFAEGLAGQGLRVVRS